MCVCVWQDDWNRLVERRKKDIYIYIYTYVCIHNHARVCACVCVCVAGRVCVCVCVTGCENTLLKKEKKETIKSGVSLLPSTQDTSAFAKHNFSTTSCAHILTYV